MKRTIRPSSAGAVLFLILMLTSACGDAADPTGVALRPDGLRVGSVVQAVVSPVGYRGGTYSRIIGPEGGTLHFGAGSLTFPRGALDGHTRITARVDGSSSAADFGPDGLSFPAHLRPILELDSRGAADPNRLRIVYVNDQNRIISVLPTTVEATRGTARAYLKHFSPYILAQN